MGAIGSIGRVFLVIFNLIFLMASLAVLTIGVLVRYFVGPVFGDVIGTVSDGLSSDRKEEFNIPDLNDVEQLPFLSDVGLTLIIFGVLLFFISFLACCGACFQVQLLLIAYVVVMILLVICQGVVGIMFLIKSSPLHKEIKTRLGDKVKDDFVQNGNDSFSRGLNIMHYLLECCGINGKTDFVNETRPATCCLRVIIEEAEDMRPHYCTTSPEQLDEEDYNQEGCYGKLQDKLLDNLLMASVGLGAILIFQILEITFAVLCVIDASNKKKVHP